MQYRSSNPNTRVGFTLVVIASLAMGPFSNDADACEWVPAGSYPVVQGEVQLWDNDYAGIVGGLLGLFPGGDKSHTSMCLDTSYGRCTKLGEQTAWPTTQEVIDRCFSNSACGLSVCCVNGFGTSEQVQSGGLLYRSPAQSYLGRWGTAFWHLDATRRSQQRNAIYNEVSATNAYNYMTDTWMYQSRYPYRISGYSEHKRIVSRRRRFNQQDSFAMRECVANRSMHLRHATQAVCVLDTRIAREMRLPNFTALHQR